jgi:hypothetical protein
MVLVPNTIRLLDSVFIAQNPFSTSATLILYSIQLFTYDPVPLTVYPIIFPHSTNGLFEVFAIEF